MMPAIAHLAPTPERLTWSEIRARYPDEWVLLVDGEWIEGVFPGFVTAVVVGHAPGSREVYEKFGHLVARGHHAHFFTGRIKPRLPLPPIGP